MPSNIFDMKSMEFIVQRISFIIAFIEFSHIAGRKERLNCALGIATLQFGVPLLLLMNLERMSEYVAMFESPDRFESFKMFL